MGKYIDLTGLSYLWMQIKSKINALISTHNSNDLAHIGLFAEKLDAPMYISETSASSLQIYDNKIYNFSALTQALTINCASMGGSFLGTVVRVCVGVGGSVILSNAAYYDGDDYEAAEEGDVFEFYIYRNSVFGKKLTAFGTEGGGTGSTQNYSTMERDTGSKWIGGESIYRKTIVFGAMPNNTSKSVAHGISSLGTVIDVQFMVSHTNKSQRPIPIVSTADVSSQLNYYVNATNVVATSASSMTGYADSHVTVWYTKSA